MWAVAEWWNTNHVFTFIQMTYIVKFTEEQMMFWGSFSYYEYELDSPSAVAMNINQHFYFNNLNDQAFPFNQHFHDEYAIDILIFQDDKSKLHWTGRIFNWFNEHSHILLYLN